MKTQAVTALVGGGGWGETAKCRVRAKPVSTQGRDLEQRLGPKCNQQEELAAETRLGTHGQADHTRSCIAGKSPCGQMGCPGLEVSVGSRDFQNVQQRHPSGNEDT